MQHTDSASHMRRPLAALSRLLFAATLVLAGWAVAPGSAFASELPTECPLARSWVVHAVSESAAQRYAATLLAELPLPPGSSESATEPAEDGSLLEQPGYGPPPTPNAVDEHAWWLVPVAPAEALTYICGHLPAGTTHIVSYEGGLRGPGVPVNEIAAFQRRHATLIVWAVRLPNGSTALRADAQVVWDTRRPASETVPSGAQLLRITVHSRSTRSTEPQSEMLSLLARLPRTVTSAGQIEAIVGSLNRLKVVQPGLRSCPAALRKTSVELVFYASADAAPLAAADIEPEGCGGVSLTLGGVPQPRLEPGSLISQLGEVLGVKPGVGPPVGQTPRLSRVRTSRAVLRLEPRSVGLRETVIIGAEYGTEFLFDLSTPAEVNIAISRLAPHSRYADTCSANSQRPRRLHRRHCQRTVAVARLTQLTEPEGEDGITFSGRQGQRVLRPGRYVAVLSARTTGGNSPVASVEFEITR